MITIKLKPTLDDIKAIVGDGKEISINSTRIIIKGAKEEDEENIRKAIKEL